MPNYVVDTSVIADFLVQGTYTANIEALMLSVSPITNLIIPAFCLVECANVLWKRVRFDNMPQEEAEIIADSLPRLPLSIVAVDTVFKRALQIGLEQKLAIYDSVYIALAEKYSYPLITADAKQEAAAKTVGVNLKAITDF